MCVCFWILVWASASASLSESLNLSFSHTLVLPGLSLPRCPFCLKHTLTHALTHRHPLPRASHSPTVQPHFLSSGSPSCRQGWGGCLTLRQGHAHLEQRQQVLDITLDALGNAWVLGMGGGQQSLLGHSRVLTTTRLGSPLTWIFTATSVPSLSVPWCTCPIEAAAKGTSSKEATLACQSLPSSSSRTLWGEWL